MCVDDSADDGEMSLSFLETYVKMHLKPTKFASKCISKDPVTFNEPFNDTLKNNNVIFFFFPFWQHIKDS